MNAVTSDETPGSTRRLGLDPAPAGLCVVQDLVNTAGMLTAPVPDLLDDPDEAQRWIDTSLRGWGEQTGQAPPRIRITAKDLAALRALRDAVRGWLTNQDEDQARHPLSADVSLQAGRLTYQPQGNGAAAISSLVHLEALLASHTGALARLKICKNPACGAAFHDASRNSTRVWHDMRTCGNVMKLRASRARRRATPAP